MSLPVRIRFADLNDGAFEEFRATLNASRKSIYFFTRVDRYYSGMSLLITSPYDDKPGAVNLEQEGKVVRVQAVPGGYGVAVALSAKANSAASGGTGESALPQPAPGSKTSGVTSGVNGSERERRCASRLAFVAPVELIDVRTGSRIHARITDLSVRGCYVDTLNPLPVGSTVRLQIRKGEAVFDALARTSSSHVGSGMGLVFADLTESHSETLRSWLSETGLPLEIGFPVLAQAAKRRNSIEAEKNYALRLIQVLVRKGILSQSEASELVDEDV